MFNRVLLAVSAVCLLANLAACGAAHHTAYVTTPLNSGVAAYRVDNHSSGFQLIPGSPYPTGLSPTAIVVHPSGKFAYISNAGEGDVSLFKVSSVFALSEVMPRTPADLNPIAMAMDPAGKFLFVCNSGGNDVSVYSIDGSSGALTQISGSPFRVGITPVHLTVSPSGKYLYVANSGSGTLAGFAIDSSGALTQVPGSPYVLSTAVNVAAGPNWVAVDPTETFVYVANLLSSNISGFTIDSGTGALTLINGAPFTAGTGPSSLVFDSTGKYLYVTNLTSSNVSAFLLNSKGVPTQLGGSPYGTGTRPSFIVLDSTTRFLYVGNQGSNTITGYSLNPASGRLNPTSTTALESAPTALVILK